VVLIVAELELSPRQAVAALELRHVGMVLPAEHLHQLSQVLRHHRQQVTVYLLAFPEVVHEEVDELAHLYLVLVPTADEAQLPLDARHPLHPPEQLQVDLRHCEPTLHRPVEQSVDVVLELGREGVQVALTGPPALVLLHEVVLVLALPGEVARGQVV
jgi:hypothetical protein